MTEGYGFGYVSDMYPSSFGYVSDSLFFKTLKTCTEHSVALDARAQTGACGTPPFDYSEL